MSARRRIDAFVLLANEELVAAATLADKAPRQAAYFLQQATEKAARALLTHARAPYGVGHDLNDMASRLPAGHPLKASLEALDKHSAAATRYRYPSTSGHLMEPPDQATLAADTEKVRSFVAAVGKHVAQMQS